MFKKVMKDNRDELNRLDIEEMRLEKKEKETKLIKEKEMDKKK
jgi:hypothetical protein